MRLTIAQALEKAMAEHRAGNISEADRHYSSILRVDPRHSDANHNLGVLALSLGKHDKAEQLIKTAIAVRPEILQFRLSHIDVLVTSGKHFEAELVITAAKDNGYSDENIIILEKHLKQVMLNHATNRAKEPSTETIAELIALHGSGKMEELVSRSNSLFKTYPMSAKVRNIIGAAYRALGKTEFAIFHYREALKLAPGFSDAYNNLGNAFRDQGDLKAAVENYSMALSLNRNHLDALQNLANALRGMAFSKPDAEIEKHIIRLLEEPNYARPKEIARAAISLSKQKLAVLEFINNSVYELSEEDTLNKILILSKVPLLLKLMDVCPIPDLEIESALTNLRRNILRHVRKLASTKDILNFQSSLALQCFTNEYLFIESPEETKLVKDLEKDIERKLSSGSKPSAVEVVCLASYRPLHRYAWISKLEMPTNVLEVISRQVTDVLLECKLKQEIKSLGMISDAISSEVKLQYEENPYPRWVNLNLSRQSNSLSVMVRKSRLKLFNNDVNDDKELQVLIAGCGTGQHSIESSMNYSNSNVLAIDLSLSSLAYAKRKTETLKIENIEYVQADILMLENYVGKFDIIESVGVLHHMNDPLAGWKHLVNCLNVNGLMKIGLYSELARRDIVKTRAEISAKKISASANAIRKFRQDLVNSTELHHQSLFLSNDFYSLSNIRDLLFHVKEHRFSISDLREILPALGLYFCGFEDIRVVKEFKKYYPNEDSEYDLSKWQCFENDFPKVFAGMYQFWCQKIE